MPSNQMQVRYSPKAEKSHVELNLPASKSISNRLLILRAFASTTVSIQNLSTARDTQTLQSLLASEAEVLDVIDAGTTFRFLTAFLSVQPSSHTLTGTPRMCMRPVGALVEALRSIGAKIDYLGKEGYPPLRIKGELFRQKQRKIAIPAHISSQFVSALAMLAPTLPDGLEISLLGELTSRPYLVMSLRLMQQWGVEHVWKSAAVLDIQSQPYSPPTVVEVEPDWSAASYWYAAVALQPELSLTLKGLASESLQGDAEIAKLMRNFGVETHFSAVGATLSNNGFERNLPLFFDFSNQPDLAQTIAVVASALNQPVQMGGLASLKVKETDRILALQSELAKFGVAFQPNSSGIYEISGQFRQSEEEVQTYDDHRMAMAFAALVFKLGSIGIENPQVVAKSYPHFWADMERVGVV